MRLRVFLALLLLLAGAPSRIYPQASPFSNSVYPAQSFTASGQTGSVIQLNGLVIPSTVGSSFTLGTITLTGTSLTTVTFSVLGSADNGGTYYPLPISTVAAPGSTPATTVTATTNGLYQVAIGGITHLKFTTSGTFTATNVTFTLTATPNAGISRLGSGGGTNPLPSAPAAGYAPLSTGPGNAYSAALVPTQAFATARQTYVLEDYLSTADGQGGTDYGYAATNFCATVGCATLVNPVGLKTTHNGICKVYTSIKIPAPIQFDANSCVFIPQSAMSSAYVTLAGCSTTVGSTTVTCASTSGLSAGMLIGGLSLGPSNYVFSVTNSTTFTLALPASRSFLGLLTIGSNVVNGIDSQAGAVGGNAQTVTGLGIPAATTISSVNYATNQWTLSNTATVGTNSPVDIALASGTVLSGLTLTAVNNKYVVIVPPSANLNTSQAKPHGPNYGVVLSNVTIQDPAYSHSSFGRSLTGVSGVQIYGLDNVKLYNTSVSGLVGQALALGGVTPSVPTGAVRESEVINLFAYSDGDKMTGQPCLNVTTGYGQGLAGQDENNTISFYNNHCVYSDAEPLTIGTYLHPGTTNGPRLLKFVGSNQFEGGANTNFSWSSTDTVRILSAGSENKFEGEYTSPGFGKAAFHISNSLDITTSGAVVSGNGGGSETFNVGLTPSSPTVTYTSAGAGAGSSFMVGPYWNGIGAQLFDGGTCNPCNVWFSQNAVNGTGTTLTLASNYTGTATSGTLLVQGGGYFFHIEPSAISLLKDFGGTFGDAPAAILSLLGLNAPIDAFMVGTGSLQTPPATFHDYSNAWNASSLNMLPQDYTVNSQSGVINFNTIWQNSSGKFQQGNVAAYTAVGTGVNPSSFLYYTCNICAGDFYNNVQNLASGHGTYQNLSSIGGNNAAFGVVGNTQEWDTGMLGSASWVLNDKTNSQTAIIVTPSTDAVAMRGPLSVPSVNGQALYWGTDSGTGTAYVITTTPAASALVTGMQVCFVPANNNGSGAPTLNLDSLGAKTITQLGNNALVGTPIQTTAAACVIYNGTNWVHQNSATPNATYGRGVIFPAGPAAGCVLNASSSTAYQCSSTSLGITSTLPGVIYSAAGTPVPTCNTAAKGLDVTVSDATAPTYLGTYASGGAVVAKALCNGTGWVTH